MNEIDSEEHYRELTKADDCINVVIHTTPYCGPCRILKREVEKIENELYAKYGVKFFTIDVSKHTFTGFRKVPTVSVCNNGFQMIEAGTTSTRVKQMCQEVYER